MTKEELTAALVRDPCKITRVQKEWRYVMDCFSLKENQRLAREDFENLSKMWGTMI